jgi:AcrR family transcriptional regulator
MSIVPTETHPRRSAAETREHVLEVAGRLFYWDGIRATGIDRVAAEAGVAPTTLYRQFASKDELVTAYLEVAGQGYRAAIADATDPAAGTPRERILALFDMVGEAVQPDRCRGCPFLMALAEFPAASAAAHASAVATKAWVRERIGAVAGELAAAEPVRDPEALADQLSLVLEGVYGSVQALGAGGPAARARATAEALLAAGAR